VYGYRDSLIMKKLEVDNAMRVMKAMYNRIDAKIAKYGELTQDEIQREVEVYRAEKRRHKGP
jgi:hypothetical protein